MSISRIFRWALGAVFFLVDAVSGAEDELVLENQTIPGGEVVEQRAGSDNQTLVPHGQSYLGEWDGSIADSEGILYKGGVF